MHTQGLDVSKYQGEINWTKVKAAGYQFAMLRAGYGSDTVDSRFHYNASECNRIRFPFGVYWFCYALNTNEAVQEADSCIKAISRYQVEYPVCFDIEESSADYAVKQGVEFTPSLARSLVNAFCRRIEQKGYFSMFYSNRDFINAYLGSELQSRYALWYARYDSPFDGTRCGIWQYTSRGSVPGINGDVDLDYRFIDYPSVIRKAGLNQLDRTPVLPVQEYVTYVVRPGDTLNKIASRFGTTVSELAKLNHISDPDKIYSGATIRIPEKNLP